MCALSSHTYTPASEREAKHTKHTDHHRATTIIGVDLHDSRLELATELGCTHVINSTGLEHDELTEKLVEIAGRGGLDFAVDTSGVPSVLCVCRVCLLLCV